MSTVARLSSGARNSAVSTRPTPETTTASMSSLPARASGRSSQLSQVISRSSKMKFRNSIARNMPPNAAICGWASVSRVS
ncbi:Uncharacterised protein [Mycobacteroides abscessus subsp. abscessus]|nr:Uncharacterised protein [Mycobacteroides abscessus subsp. abscessus]